jgi:uncharacterized iron-regulated membrane protein
VKRPRSAAGSAGHVGPAGPVASRGSRGPRAASSWLHKLHRWLGLLLALPLLALALSGALLAAGKPLDEWQHRSLFSVSATAVAPGEDAFIAALDAVHADLRQRYGADAGFTLRLPQQPGQSLRVFVRAPGFDGMAFYEPVVQTVPAVPVEPLLGPTTTDPATAVARAHWLGQRGRSEGWWPWLFELHSEAFAGERGKALLSISATLALGLLALGGALWWPRRGGPWFGVAWRSPAPRRWRDVHRVGGALALPLLLAIVLSGLYMAWQPIRAWVSQALHEPPVKPPALPKSASASASAAAAGPVLLSTLVRRAQAPWPEGRVVYVTLRPSQPTRVRVKLPQDPHPNGLSSVWLDPRDGRELARVRVDELDAGQRWVSWIYPLHSAQLFGPLQRGLWTLLGLALAMLVASGVWLWSRRRGTRSARRAAALDFCRPHS